ncbi:MAG: acetylornithine/succinylornithine family transaminase, partial [Clostridiales bacterium]|nr:acetylornithine/succinylornithine family transaminase [Clostridiales bacterium]
MDIKQLDSAYIANTYARFDLCLAHGRGSLVYDEKGKEYIDLGGGIAVNTFGFCDDEWTAAVTSQLGALQHASNLYYTSPQVNLAQLLCEKTGMKKVFFGNSGAEANECAIKAARKYSSDKFGGERNVIITLKNSFHGRTVTTLSATGQDVFHKDFGPFTGGFVYAEANNIDSVKTLISGNNVCAVMMELIQGEGGVLVLNRDFVFDVQQLCDDNDILLIIDEVQTGNGRTGELYCYMNYGIHPDIVTTAKGLAGGLPLGATLFSEKTQGVLGSGSHGSTFGGNPVCAAGALNILQRLDEPLMKRVKAKSEYIVSELTGATGIKSISGIGLMLGIETERPAKEVVLWCIENGVIPLTAKNKVRLL